MKTYNLRLKKTTVVYLVLLVFLIIFFVFPLNNRVGVSSVDGTLYPSQVITKDEKISQEFYANVDNLNEIDIKFSTYNVVNKDGSILVKLTDDKENVLFSKEVSLYELKDNESFVMKFEKIKHSKNKKYTINIEYTDYHKGNSLAYWYENKLTGDNLLKVNNREIERSLYFEEYGTKKNYYLLFYLAFAFVINMIVSVVNKEEK